MSGADAQTINLSGADLTDTNLTNTLLTGASFTSVIWDNTTCPDGMNSTVHGNTCVNNLNYG